jgi:hypothetical protein
MQMKKLYAFLALICIAFYSFAQQSPTQVEPAKNEVKAAEKPARIKKVRTQNGNLISKYEFRPRIFVGGGLMKSFGEVVDFIHARSTQRKRKQARTTPQLPN